MIFKIKDKKFLESIKNNQTRELFNKFNEVCKNEAKKETLRKVLVMTPEFIHINSFMYEPLIDMDIIELRDLYKKVDELNNTQPT